MMENLYKYILLILILAGLGYGANYYLNKNETKKMETPKIMQWNEPPKLTVFDNYFAVMETTKGTMKIELYSKETPVTANNFVFLARQGFYDGTKFHRIIKDFMIQGGDPECTPSTGTSAELSRMPSGRCGAGGPGYRFNDEPITRNYERGTIAMANSGPNTNGSQFFIMTKALPLQKNYVIFGKVVEGLDVLDKIAATPVKANSTGELSVPLEDVLIKSVRIIEN